MIILDPVTHETIWGGQKLLPYAKRKAERIGHLYSLCCEPGLETRILNGPYAGRSFHAYFADHKNRFGLGQYDAFPLILALTEADQSLSIQVHPGDALAAEEEGAAYGKNESWYFIDAPESGTIYNGCTASDTEEVRRRLEAGRMMDAVDTLAVRPGDYVFVEAGTLHAISAGALVYEIEENSPWTYRLYDYDRTDAKGNKRELHVEKGMKALDVRLKSKSRPMGSEWIDERRYRVRRFEKLREYRNDADTLQCLTLLRGGFTAEGVPVSPGMTAVLEPGERAEGDIAEAIVAEPK